MKIKGHTVMNFVTANNNCENRNMLVELTPVTYLALCGLVRDALLTDSDASPLLQRVAKELGTATAGAVPEELAGQPAHLEALRRIGFAA